MVLGRWADRLRALGTREADFSFEAPALHRSAAWGPTGSWGIGHEPGAASAVFVKVLPGMREKQVLISLLHLPLT